MSRSLEQRGRVDDDLRVQASLTPLLYPEEVEVEMHPLKLRYTHGSISKAFRNGLRLDDAIHHIVDDALRLSAFPPVEAVAYNDDYFVVRGNRRLFVHRVLAALGAARSIKVIELPWCHRTIQAMRWDTRLGRMASKWDRSLSSCSAGLWVCVDSQFESLQLDPDWQATYGLAPAGYRRAASVHACRHKQFPALHQRQRAASADPNATLDAGSRQDDRYLKCCDTLGRVTRGMGEQSLHGPAGTLVRSLTCPTETTIFQKTESMGERVHRQWMRYFEEAGANNYGNSGYYWWRHSSGRWFQDGDPRWQRYRVPSGYPQQGRVYMWNELTEEFFYEDTCSPL